MDLALQLIIEMNQWIWSRFKDDLKDATPEEIDWRPLPRIIAALGRTTAAALERRTITRAAHHNRLPEPSGWSVTSDASPRFSPGNTFGHAPGADPQYPQSIPENAGETARFSPENLSFPS